MEGGVRTTAGSSTGTLGVQPTKRALATSLMKRLLLKHSSKNLVTLEVPFTVRSTFNNEPLRYPRTS